MTKVGNWVNAELSYNPYLYETEIKFEGKPPKNNSYVSQFLNKPLQDWIHEVPAIFLDEMNGYEFNLDFKGTVLDFEELKNAFAKAGFSEKEVRLRHVNILPDRKKEALSLKELYLWLRNNPGKNLTSEHWKKIKTELDKLRFAEYILVLITGGMHGHNLPDDTTIKVETASNAEALHGTLLTNIPIVFYMDSITIKQLQSNLNVLQDRDDISNRQLFFWIPEKEDRPRIEHIISELGIEFPQIINALDDIIVKRYCYIYPASSFIHESIGLLQSIKSDIKEKLKADKEQMDESGSDVTARIEKIDEKISNCQKLLNRFQRRDTYKMPDVFPRIHDQLMEFLDHWNYGWRLFSTKVESMPEAEDAIGEFITHIDRYYKEFSEAVDEYTQNEAADIQAQFSEWCSHAKTSYQPQFDGHSVKIKPSKLPKKPPDFSKSLLSLKESEGTHSVWYFKQWREYISKEMGTLAEIILTQRYQEIIFFYDTLAKAYERHINKAIKSLLAEKEALSLQLSDEEKLYQENYDWWETLSNRLNVIERG